MVVPIVIDGRALKDSSQYGGYGIRTDNGEATPTGSHKPGCSEDTEVQGQDRELGEVYGKFVEDLVEIEHL